ncbi:MAG: DUF3379 family protein [Xanthomonadales bacterium]|nr:hypothetical protein [Xanthomonadales bacterium]MCC6593543.1 DUF3379 family protein [Xanthomonadales bacterium]MCE7930992.1 DUF3379 family protein [Xanthomonadales bacterium PRO6]
MDCSEFRRQLLIDPCAPALAQAAQQRVCEDAPARLAEALALEHRIVAALAVPVPPDLAERVIAALPAGAPQIAPPNRWWPLALAASLLLAALLGFAWLRAPTGPGDLIAESVAHLAHEPWALTRTETVPPPLVARMFAQAGLRLDEGSLELRYLNRCPLAGHKSVHMVMRGEQGPVTVLYVPDTTVDRLDTRRDMVAVRSLPFADGTLLLLAESDYDFNRIEQAWHAAAGGAVARL